MEVNKTRYHLVTDILAFENGETQLFNSGGVVKRAYFPQKSGVSL